MKLIAHRGLINGPDVNLENRPEQIQQSLAAGYDCEIDFWCIEFPSHRRYYLGHDRPDYEVDWKFFSQDGLWIHAKNLAALHVLTHSEQKFNYFWHQKDDYTLTSQGYIWAYPGQPVTSNTIMVMPEMVDPTLKNTKNINCFGICSDWIELIKLDITK